MLGRTNSLLRSLVIPITVFAVTAAAAPPFPEAGQLPPQTGWPDPLVNFQGEKTASKKLWVKTRRPELKALFEHYMYGTMPPAPAKIVSTIEREDKQFFGGKATLKEVTIAVGPANVPRLHLLLVRAARR